MSPRQARRERREAERKARKAEIRRMNAARDISPPVPAVAPEQSRDPAKAGERLPAAPLPEFSEVSSAGFASQYQNPDGQGGESPSAERASNPLGFVSQSDEPALLSEAKIQLEQPALLSEARRAINRVNAQYSTGPRSIAGKLASSRNSLQHGLASGTLIIPGEDPAAFDQLTAALLEEHRPAGDTETLLVHEMARSWWLTQRAIRLQNECFTDGGIDERRLALLLRYQTTHERAFHKALDTLLKLKRSRDRQQAVPATPNAIGFVSHNTMPTVREGIGFVSQNNPSSAPELGFVSQNPAAGSPNQPPIAAEAA